MRTAEQIIEKINAVEDYDLFGFIRSDLLEFLPFSAAKPFLKEETTENDWSPGVQSSSKENIVRMISEYMPFAWDKANNNRGLSAMRSIMHMQAWLWMLGEDDASKQIEEYSCYGKPQLAAICEHLGIEWKTLDDGRWVDNEDDETGREPFAANLSWNS